MKKRLSFNQLIEKNKEEIKRDENEMDKVDKRIEARNVIDTDKRKDRIYE